LNCAMGSAEAAGEVEAFAPDLVLLQESPPRKDVEALAKRLYGASGWVVWGSDGSLLGRGRLIETHEPPSMRFAWARFQTQGDIEMEAMSVHLATPSARIDLWSPDCWREQAHYRFMQREEAQTIAQALGRTSPDLPVIVAGDFNAPAHDAIFRLFRPRLEDSFSRAGRGWGNTILNDFPVLRIDQVWISPSLRPVSVTAHKSQYSDHRMVVCDLMVGK
jgi:vancomycin resistance protein VanJ